MKYQIETKSAEERTMILSYLESKDMNIFNGSREAYERDFPFSKEPVVVIDTTDKKITGIHCINNTYTTIITYDALYNVVQDILGEKTLPDIGTYKVSITPTLLRVGCQTIPKEKIEELVKLLEIDTTYMSINCSSVEIRTLVLNMFLSHGYQWHGEQGWTAEKINAEYPWKGWKAICLYENREITGSIPDHTSYDATNSSWMMIFGNTTIVFTEDYSATINVKNKTVTVEDIVVELDYIKNILSEMNKLL